MPSGAQSAAGLPLSDWIGLGSLIATVVGIPLALIGAHFHSAIRKDDARAAIIQRLTSTRWRDMYHDYLRTALRWLDEKIDPTPFARANPNGRRMWGVKSLSWCVAVSLVYGIGFYLVSWVMYGPGRFGQVTLIKAFPTPDWIPEWFARFLFVWLVLSFGLLVWLIVTTAALWGERMVNGLTKHLSRRKRLVLRNVSIAGSLIIVTAVTGAVLYGTYIVVAGVGITAFAALCMAVALPLAAAGMGPPAGALGRFLARIGLVVGLTSLAVIAGVTDPASALILLLFLFALPCLNGLLDWLSLTVSRWFGRWIIAGRDAPAALAITLGVAIADLIAAVAFAFVVAWLLAFGVEATSLALGLALDLDGYVKVVAEAPWTTGFWATSMVLSTLVPTAIHFILAVGAVLMAWQGNPLHRLAARRLTSGNEADYLFPQLYLTFSWMVPTFAVPVALIWGLAQLTELFTSALGPVETLPDLLRDTAWHGIDTARGLGWANTRSG